MRATSENTSASGFAVPALGWRGWLAVLVLSLAALYAYIGTFSVPFVFDDLWSIPMNSSIRGFDTALFPPNDEGQTVSGRPLLNLSFAVNHAISGREVWSYHVGNLLIHIAAGLTLFGLMRRIFWMPSLASRFGKAAVPLAFVISAIWMLHPLQTESVTYIVQRAESLMALFYLLTLYCFARSTSEGGRVVVWQTISVVCCLLGMASKEVMVSAPVIVLLLDRALVAGSFREAWARRKIYYGCLAATWVLLIWLVAATGTRGNTAGLGLVKSHTVADTSVWTYLLTQAKAIVIYLKLSVWPSGQIFDYGVTRVTSLGAVWAQGVCVLALAAGAIWLLVRRPVAGLVAFFFFAVLAPTSSFIPVATEPIAEHRMYLALVSLVIGAALGSYHLLERRSKLLWRAASCAVICALAVATIQRNKTYGDELSLWGDTVRKVPDNMRANNNYANALTRDAATCEESLRYSRRAFEINPEFASAYNNYGYALSKLGHYNEALAYYDKALSYKQSGMEVMLSNRGHALYKLGRLAEAESDYKASLQIRPDYEEALNNYGNILHATGRMDESLRYLDKALKLDPKFASAWNNRGNVFSAQGLDREEAMRCYKRAAELDPKLWEAQDNVGRYCMMLGRYDEAVPYFKAALGARPPDEAVSYYRLANALMLSNRQAESIPAYQKVVALRPDFHGAHHNLAVALSNAGKVEESLSHFQTALRLDDRLAPIHVNYAAALAKLGRYDEALAAVQAALRIDPANERAREQAAGYERQKQQALKGAEQGGGHAGALSYFTTPQQET